jgi:hypothetical protein
MLDKQSNGGARKPSVENLKLVLVEFSIIS